MSARWWIEPVLEGGKIVYNVYEAHVKWHFLLWHSTEWVLVQTFYTHQEAVEAIGSWAEIKVPPEELYDRHGERIYTPVDH